MSSRHLRGLRLAAGWVMVAAWGAGCSRQVATSRPATQPVGQIAATQPAESPTDQRQPPATQPTTQPDKPDKPVTSKPAAPKFTVVSLGPDGKETRWIEVEKWTDGIEKGSVVGKWLGPNKMGIEVRGAQQVVLKLGKLPIRSGRRIILHIEDANMTLSPNLLPTVRMRRSPTGAWSAVKDK